MGYDKAGLEKPTIVEPQTDEERLKYLINMIFEIRKKRLLKVDQLAKKAEALDKELIETRKSLMNAEGREDINRWTAVIKSFSTQKLINSERRYLMKQLHLEEGQFRAELYELTGKSK